MYRIENVFVMGGNALLCPVQVGVTLVLMFFYLGWQGQCYREDGKGEDGKGEDGKGEDGKGEDGKGEDGKGEDGKREDGKRG